VGDNRCASTTGNEGSSNNLRLLSNWAGAPSTVAPEGAAIRRHLLAQHFAASHYGAADIIPEGIFYSLPRWVTVPPAETPEVPNVLMLAGAALGVLGTGTAISRRRRRRLLARESVGAVGKGRRGTRRPFDRAASSFVE
jgi:hypothetical protein